MSLLSMPQGIHLAQQGLIGLGVDYIASRYCNVPVKLLGISTLAYAVGTEILERRAPEVASAAEPLVQLGSAYLFHKISPTTPFLKAVQVIYLAATLSKIFNAVLEQIETDYLPRENTLKKHLELHANEIEKKEIQFINKIEYKFGVEVSRYKTSLKKFFAVSQLISITAFSVLTAYTSQTTIKKELASNFILFSIPLLVSNLSSHLMKTDEPLRRQIKSTFDNFSAPANLLSAANGASFKQELLGTGYRNLITNAIGSVVKLAAYIYPEG